MMETAPSAFEGLKLGLMQDRVNRGRELLVDFGNDTFDRSNRVIRYRDRAGQRLLGKRPYRAFDRGFCSIRFRFELLFKEIVEFGYLNGPSRRLRSLEILRFSHGKESAV